MPDTQARKESRNRWNEQNPPSTIRLPMQTYTQLKELAEERKIGYHGLLKQIITEWTEQNL